MATEIFDVDAALKEKPEDKVAQYLADLHGVNREDYLKDGKTDAQFLEEFGHLPLPSTEQPVTAQEQPKQQQSAASGTDGGLPLIGAALGAGLGTTAAGITNAPDLAKKFLGLSGNQPAFQAPARQFASPIDVSQRTKENIVASVVNPELYGSTTDVYNWSAGKQKESGQYGKQSFLGGVSQGHESDLQKLRAEVEARNPMYTVLPGTNGMIGPKVEADRMRQAAAQHAAQIKDATKTLAANAADLRAARLKAQQKLLNKSTRTNMPLQISGLKPVMGGVAGYNAADMLQQAGAGNYGRAALSGLGTAGALAPMMKNLTPKQRVLALGTSIAAPLINRAMDHADGGSIEGYADGGSIQHFAGGSIQHFAGGKDVKSKLIQAGLDAVIGKQPHVAPKITTPYLPGVHYADPNVAPTMTLSEALGNSGSEGKTLRFTETDRSRVHGPNKGGSGFSGLQHYSPEHQNADAVWGFGNKKTAEKKIQQNGDPEKTVWTTFIGSPNQHKSNTVVLQNAMDNFHNANKQNLVHPAQIDLMNNRIRSLRDKDTGELIFDPLFDLTDPKALDAANSFARRSAIGDVLLGTGVKKPMLSREFKQQYPNTPWADAADMQATLARETDPDFINANTHDVGTRLFTLDNGIIQRPDLNVAFPWQVTGQDSGFKFKTTPKEFAMPTWLKQYEGRVDKSGKPYPANYYDLARNDPSQFVDDKFLSFLQKNGFKKGGHIDEATLNSLFE